jgi:2-amino-4-hydroxy-6-hydroxymethyldihydropteridine diphosphokinase
MAMNTAYLSIGSNVDKRIKNCLTALEEISAFLKIKEVSSFYETEPYGVGDQDDYVNCAVMVETSLTPYQLLDYLINVENSMGRITKGDKSARIIDLDIIFYGDLVLNTDDLIIPHEQAHLRRFVLEPICEIDSQFTHPVLNKTISELIEGLTDTLRVEKIGKYY